MREAPPPPPPQMAVPHLFMCPISLDLFKVPVTLCTGHTYDRSSIEKWLSAGNFTCPVTMQRLHDLSMVPNHTLRHLIDQWLQIGPHFDPEYLQIIDSLASLKLKLENPDAIFENKLQTLEKIQALSHESSSGTSLLQLGFLPSLLQLLFGKVESKFSQEYIDLVEQTLACVLRLLSLGGDYQELNMLKGAQKLEAFRAIFDHGNSTIKKSLCSLIEAISVSLETRELCSILGENREILHSLILVLQQSNGESLSEGGIKAIFALSSMESNRENLVQEGVVNALITYISNAERQERNLVAKALATLELLLGSTESAKQALINNSNGVNCLVKMIFRVSDHEGSGSAVKSLMIVCSESLEAREEAISGGVLTQLLLLLQSQCSGRTKTKARMLLKLLRSKWDEEPKHL